MVYLLAAATSIMLGYMFWSTAFRMRRDRISAERSLTRGKHAFRPRERARFLLGKAFPLPDEQSQWEHPLVLTLDGVSAHPQTSQRR